MVNFELYEQLLSFIRNVEEHLKYRFTNPMLLAYAFVDEYEFQKDEDNNTKKLAYLGDATLKLILTELVMENEKGTLTNINNKRQELESNNYQANLFDNLKLEEIILTTQPEKSRSEHNKGTAVEAILGAMYLDNGLEAVKRFIKGWE